MQYTQLGRTGLSVSRLCLGTMNFGRDATPEESFPIMDRALDAGINFFDTADVYGGRKFEGWTEQVMGQWFAQGGGRREKIVLATKCYNRMGEGPNDRGLSAYHIRRACDDSLRRMGVDHIDLYQMHHIDRTTPWDEIWQAMEQLVREGKISYVGSSNFAGWHIATAQGAAVARHFLGLVSEQSLYNLSQRTVELEVLPACRHHGLGFIAWSPLAGGLLGGVLGKEQGVRRAREGMADRIEKHRKSLEAYEKLAVELKLTPAELGQAWVLAQPGVTGPIIGPRTMDQLEAALKAMEVKLSEETIGQLDEIWPGPGGEAPEAYAW
ncbi:MAG: aldo/keto reductase [Phycisphaeraceae bacterium]|nr:aldo/keto reductase [Phycisphaeraceae bacterium]